MVLCKKEFGRAIDSAIFPGIQGGPLMHVIAAKAVALKQAMTEEFSLYQKQVIANAKRLCSRLEQKGYRIVSGGTDTHLFLVDLSQKGVTGKQAQEALEPSGIMVNKNLIPFDSRGPSIASGIRLGTPAVTTRGMKESEMDVIADLIDKVLTNLNNERVYDETRAEARALCEGFPFYSRMYEI